MNDAFVRSLFATVITLSFSLQPLFAHTGKSALNKQASYDLIKRIIDGYSDRFEVAYVVKCQGHNYTLGRKRCRAT